MISSNDELLTPILIIYFLNIQLNVIYILDLASGCFVEGFPSRRLNAFLIYQSQLHGPVHSNCLGSLLYQFYMSSVRHEVTLHVLFFLPHLILTS
jgi:hypothetical protein